MSVSICPCASLPVIASISVSSSVCNMSLCVHISTCVCVHLSECLSICLCVRPCVCPCVRVSVCVSVRVSVCVSACLSACPSVCLAVCPSACSSLCLSVFLCMPLRPRCPLLNLFFYYVITVFFSPCKRYYHLQSYLFIF